MTVETQMRVEAFVREIANACDTCQRRGADCGGCVAKRARILLGDIAGERAKPLVDYSFAARCAEIRRILTMAGRPLLAREIDLKGKCSPQLKLWTLNQMVRMGTLGRKPAYKFHNKKRHVFHYFLKCSNKKDDVPI